MRFISLLITVAAFSAAILSAVHADTPLDVLGVEKTVNDVSRRAQETGDHIAQAFAQQALKVIAEWKKANASLIDQTFDRLDKQSQDLFREINDTATRLEKGEAVSFLDLQRTMVTAGSTISKIPGVSKTPQVTFYWPTMITPTGEPKFSIHVIGSLLAEANPTASLNGQPITVKKLSDNEIGLDIDRDALPKNDSHETKPVIKLSYRVDMSAWYNPLSWWSTELRERDIELTVFPTTPGTAIIRPKLLTETWETKVDEKVSIGGVGRDHTDSYGYTITPKEKDDGWIIDKAAQEHAHFDDDNGHGDGGSSCVGYDNHSFTDTSLSFLIQHGHNTDWAGHKSDANQICRMWIYLKRLKKSKKDGDPITEPLSWMSDVDPALPDNTDNYSIEISLYNGQSYKIDSDQQIPYGLFQIFRSPKTVKFRPREQRDF